MIDLPMEFSEDALAVASLADGRRSMRDLIAGCSTVVGRKRKQLGSKMDALASTIQT